MDFEKVGRGRFRGFRAPEIDRDRVADSIPDVDLERFARQLRDVDLDRLAKQLREIDLDRFAKQIQSIDLDRLGRQVRDSAGDVRDRIQGKQEPDRGVPTAALLAGLGIGAAATYLLDPEQGRRRRALVRDQLLKARRMTNEAMEGRSKDVANRARGAAAQTRSATRRTGQASRAQEATAAAEANPTAGPASDLP
jgi:gas vesicle protein